MSEFNARVSSAPNYNKRVVPVEIINKSKHPLPKYETPGSSGMDIRADLDAPLTINPNQTLLVPTGLYVAIPYGFEIQVRPRSGLSLKTKLRLANSVGTVDSDYRGHMCCIIENIGSESITIEDGERIAQLVLCPVYNCLWREVDELSATERTGGFGSTGQK